jgi:hypothetical protein
MKPLTNTLREVFRRWSRLPKKERDEVSRLAREIVARAAVQTRENIAMLDAANAPTTPVERIRAGVLPSPNNEVTHG